MKLWIQTCFSLILLSCYSSAYALSNSFFDLQWVDITYKGRAVSYLDKDEFSLAGTRRVCEKYRYGVVMLHGSVHQTKDSNGNPISLTERQGIDAIKNESKFLEPMYELMENFAQNCAVVVVPEANESILPTDRSLVFKQWNWTQNSADSLWIKRIIRGMRIYFAIDKVIIMGGSSGAVMAHNIAKQSINDGLVKVDGVIIADGISSELACRKPCLPHPDYGQYIYDNGEATTLYNASKNEGYPDTYDNGYDGIRLGIGKKEWNIKTLIISSYEDENSLIPSVLKDRFGSALERQGHGKVTFKSGVGENHAPWRSGYKYIKDFLSDEVQLDDQ